MSFFTSLLLVVSFFSLGVVATVLYMLKRMLGSDGWDKSNILNALRLLAHVLFHPEDFGKMYYLTPEDVMRLESSSVYGDNKLTRPFWYVSEDELSEVVRTRP